MSLFFLFLIILALFIIGLCFFSLSGGFVLYLTTLTNKHSRFDPQSFSSIETSSVMKAHTRDPRIMISLNQAKDRWHTALNAGCFERLTVTSLDGLNLFGWFWQFKNASRTVILVHGMQDTAAGMAYLAESYNQIGWNVLSIDLRAHGESEGVNRTMGVRESDDLVRWISLLEKKYSHNWIVLHGVSMGAATVLLYGGRKKVSDSVRGIIADSSYASYMPVFLKLVRKLSRSRLISTSLVWGANVSSIVFSGVSFQSMSPEKNLSRIPVPVLLFHGQEDKLVPLSMVQGLLDVDQFPLYESVIIAGAPHIGAWFYMPDLYMDKILEFTERISGGFYEKS